MIRSLQFALSMEKTLKDEFESQVKNPQVPEFKPVFELLIQCQTSILQILSQNQNDISYNNSIEINEQILGTDTNWKIAPTITSDTDASPYLVHLWIVNGLLDKSAQFYRQAASNSAYPQRKLFFNSIAEIKLMQKRRIDSILRSIYNIVWADVGFAPVSLGKS